ncbi:RNA ligase family protein [Streptomyces sp. NBC_01433]|uniref:RNA ligase family protein n=1 Tax=Streptomyces sp. NBC_01433 TaxID=2903864 RepID=UPI00224D7635|nr:RNA ligase family protein [Streptomyces sp. NBC_01433]MCX4682340.1 RNA ligase family protein [Streptomyces sp. NBC_01433]
MPVADLDLNALNSATKYPSIFTYHELAQGGRLIEKATAFTGDVILTEKVDGTNARIISLPGGDYLLGSREELFYARGDRVWNPRLSIVDALRPLAERITSPDTGAVVYYLEVYGGQNISRASGEYTSGQTVGHRLFDVATIQPSTMEQPRAAIAAWRDNGGQDFLTEDELTTVAKTEGIELTPRLATVAGSELPTGIEEMQAFLDRHMPTTLVALDPDVSGRSEGIVLRTSDRSVIAKARFQNYERTLQVRNKRR